jgi:iron-sulfur cluster repair protein YtfE (RIC family)
MIEVRSDTTVATAAHRSAGTLAVLEARGINHCCGAHLTVAEAAAAAGVDLASLLAELNEAA